MRIDRLIRFENERMCRFAAAEEEGGVDLAPGRASAAAPFRFAFCVVGSSDSLPFVAVVGALAASGAEVEDDRDDDGGREGDDERRRRWVWNESEVKCVRNDAGPGFVT